MTEVSEVIPLLRFWEDRPDDVGIFSAGVDDPVSSRVNLEGICALELFLSLRRKFSCTQTDQVGPNPVKFLTITAQDPAKIFGGRSKQKEVFWQAARQQGDAA